MIKMVLGMTLARVSTLADAIQHINSGHSRYVLKKMYARGCSS